ncbi:SDR family oxidoreductase [Polynucleobacter sp. MG-6-Vaara-E2]|uniref:SDR family NAD(P)-dependent oxidoreductase n=1 Tax=Polynucleobacter sp. MG-6-Vaara-E2 TaxID=2576932 RepID=UPI001BFEBD22|nr:SDR family oxidoreductase [Polynucleobacter sp. MG-6-Vaara-E2]QWD96911.1 SDR family oxidoreductase [Polynucleobacter sp. MG-6-Vaara-E2]
MSYIKKAIIAGISSDIGISLLKDWADKGWDVYGTYRKKSKELTDLEDKLGGILSCDFSNSQDVDSAVAKIESKVRNWDVLVMAPGLQDPVGLFADCNFDDWTNSIMVNFVNQIRFVHRIIGSRNMQSDATPSVIFFAGGGTNNAPTHYSAYIASKIALMKMTELLSVEIPDTKFVILGPGWVKTKIHDSTLNAKSKAGSNYERTIDMFSKDEWVPMSSVISCCNWLIDSQKELLTGRNFSLVFDKWGTEDLNARLENDKDLYKLRRYGN